MHTHYNGTVVNGKNSDIKTHKTFRTESAELPVSD